MLPTCVIAHTTGTVGAELITSAVALEIHQAVFLLNT